MDRFCRQHREDDRNVLMLSRKNGQRYVFIYTDGNRGEVLRMLGRFAIRDDLDFSWYDAAILSQRIRQQADEPETGEAS